MKAIVKQTIIVLLVIFGHSLLAQDVIHKKNGEILKVVVKEINDSQVKYYHFDDPNEVLFTVDRVMIDEIKFAYGKDYKEKEPILTDDYFEEDQNMSIKISMSSMLFDAFILSYDKAIDPQSGFQISAKVFGIGFGPSSDVFDENSGFGLEAAYRLKFKAMKRKEGEYRPGHLLAGGYIMPTLGLNYLKTESYSSTEKNKTINLGLNFGKQNVIQNKIIIDYYAGFSFFAGSNEYTSMYSDRDYREPYINSGDVFGSSNFAVNFGFKVGFVFGKYGANNQKTKKRR